MATPVAIPDEEWMLLARAVADPMPQMIAVEAVDSDQADEVERRLSQLVGKAQRFLGLEATPGQDNPETLWRQARQLTDEAPSLPLLLVRLAPLPPLDTTTERRQVDFWRGMNQLRENWHALPAQIVFLLNPTAFQHLSRDADHLKRWIALNLHLWEGATDLEVLERPGRLELAQRQALEARLRQAPPPSDRHADLERQRMKLLAQQYEAAEASTSPTPRLRRYLLPLIEGYLALGDLDQARAWRRRIEPDWEIEAQDREALSALDERLAANGRPPGFDVFLSHNSKDKPTVRELAQALRERGLIVWLDEDELRPGLNWQAQLESGIKLSNSIAVLIGRDGLGPWENEETQGALIHAVNDGRPVIPVLLPDAPGRPDLPLFLKTRTWVDLRPAMDDAKLDRLIWGITGKRPNAVESTLHEGYRFTKTKPRSLIPNPSPGGGRELSPLSPRERGGGEGTTVAHPPPAANPYDPWTPATPPRFFGRDKLLRRLGEALDQGRSVSLVGDARIGKTSVLQTWAAMARERGRVAKLLSGEGPEGISCVGFVAAVTGNTFTDLTPDEAADLILQWLDGESPALPPLILVDEAERMLAHLPHRFFERLRGMLGRVCLIFASRREIGEIARDDHLTSPLLNRLELQRLGLLEAAGVDGLIGLGAGVLTPEDSDRMREWAGRHPFYLSLLGHYLWDARCHGEGPEEAMEEFRENAYARLNELWQTLTACEQGLLSAAVLGDGQVSDITLKRRGLQDDGHPFGRVLTEWIKRRQ